MAKKRSTKAKPDRGRFAAEYLVDLNATQAALRCGYSPRTAGQQGARLLKSVEIAAQVAEAMAKREAETGITAKKVLEELGLIGFADMAHYVTFRPDGDVVFDWSDLPPGASRVIAEVTSETYMDGSGEDAREVKRTKFKLHPKTSALNLIAQHLGMLVQKHEHTGKDGAALPPTAIHVTLVRPKE